MNNTLLLVDDESGIRKVLSISLRDLGYEVITARSGREALRLFEEKRTDIVLTDIKMPEFDGIELLKKIKKIHPDTEVIMLTGHGEMDLAVQSLKHQATDFITKPIHDEALEIALERAKERIRLKQQLKDYTENLEALVAEKTEKLIEAETLAAVGETVAGLSHAIKNIAGGLSGGAFVLEKGIDLDDKEYLQQGWEMIRNNVDRITHLSMDLLNFAKPNPLSFKPGDPNTPARDVLTLMAPAAKKAGIRLSAKLASDLSDVHFDAENIYRSLLNLVANAVDACTAPESIETSKEVRIETRRVQGWGVEYLVADNGCGIGDVQREKIFQRFFTTKGSRGTGIGLMLTRRIVDQHKGRIRFESEPGTGTRFFIRLPVNPA
ncbi:MAG: response regulator [Desulfobacteraceae bacterium]|nr:response regulator [Desulfobacteraceae bacterium]